MDSECEYGNCGSRAFHVGDDGYTYCSEGHRQLQSGLITADDDERQPSTGLRNVRRVQEEIIPTALVGKQALEHYMVCFQLVLWKQVHSLVSDKGLPVELETIVRDLWTLQLQTLQDKFDESDDIAEQLYSSQVDTDTDEEGNASNTNKLEDRLPRVLTGVCLNYLAILLLRLPITTVDIYDWISDGKLLYYRAIKALDSSMRIRLPGRYHVLLEPQRVLSPEQISRALVGTMSFFAGKVGMAWPVLNFRLCLHRFVYALHLPLEVYAATIRLAGLLEIDFSFDPKGSSQQLPVSLRPPEARLATLLIVATKMLFPFDGGKRLPRRPTELAALGLDWQAWNKARLRTVSMGESQNTLEYREALQTTENDVLNMSEEKLDQYMDWYQGTYVDEGARETRKIAKEAGFRKAMYRMFPINRAASEQAEVGDAETHSALALAAVKEESLKNVQAALQPLRVLSDEAADEAYASPQRPGSHYKRYRTVSELHGHAKAFYEETAKLGGLPLEAMVLGVFTMEKRLEHWETQARREAQ